jgi:hypothetical protein
MSYFSMLNERWRMYAMSNEIALKHAFAWGKRLTELSVIEGVVYVMVHKDSSTHRSVVSNRENLPTAVCAACDQLCTNVSAGVRTLLVVVEDDHRYTVVKQTL